MRKQLVATRSLSYANKRLRAGESFTAPGQDAKVLVAIGRATYLTAVAEPAVTKAPPQEDVPEAPEATDVPVVQEEPEPEAKPNKAKRGKNS